MQSTPVIGFGRGRARAWQSCTSDGSCNERDMPVALGSANASWGEAILEVADSATLVSSAIGRSRVASQRTAMPAVRRPVSTRCLRWHIVCQKACVLTHCLCIARIASSQRSSGEFKYVYAIAFQQIHRLLLLPLPKWLERGRCRGGGFDITARRGRGLTERWCKSGRHLGRGGGNGIGRHIGRRARRSGKGLRIDPADLL